MKAIRSIFLLLALFLPSFLLSGQETEAEVDFSEVIFSHIGDSYQWHIADFGNKHVELYLPVIVRSKTTGWHLFSSKKLEDGEYQGFRFGSADGPYAGKIVEQGVGGAETRPLDISITKNVLALFFSSGLLLLLILLTARWYKRHDVYKEAPTGLAAFMEPIVMMIDEVARENIGEEDYARYSPYLCMAFLWIILNNLLGIVPLFPFGANLTGNIAITMTLALFTFSIVNFTGRKQYYKEMFLPDVPLFLKPVLPVIEVFSALMKPVSLTVRLFANMLAGHIMILCIVCVIFVVAKMGPALFGSMTVVSVIFGIFLDFLEFLVSFIQAYVFTILSSIYIGIARAKE
jgi:F-type H+-transporting ATPase subunit a